MLVALMILFVVGFGILTFYLRPAFGFIIGIVLSAVALICGIALDIVELTATAPFIFFLSMIITALRPAREVARWPRTWARGILSVLGLIVFGAVGFAICGQAGPFGIIFMALFIGAVIGAFATSELNRTTYIITTIGSSIRQNLPLPMALEMAAYGLNNKRGGILRDIKKWLVEGYSLSESLKRGYPRCPGYAIALIAAGERIGQLPQAIAALEQDLVAKAATNKKVRPVPMMYPPLVLFFVFIMLSLLMVFVVPKFGDVLNEFDVPLPAATQFLMTITKVLRSTTAAVISLVLLVMFLAAAVVFIRVRTRPRRPEKPYLISRAGDFLKWHIPFLRFYEWSRAMQRVVGMLRLSLNAGCTVNEAIKNTLMLDVNVCFRNRLKRWLVMVEHGDDIGQSAGQCGLGSGLTWAFCEAGNRGNTINILDTLETSYRWAYSRAAGLVRIIIGPCETIAMGLIVGFVMYAVFVPIVTIIVAVGSSMP